MKMQTIAIITVLSGLCGADNAPARESSLEQGLIGYWKLSGDCRDHSGNGSHGVNHGVDLETGSFNGRGAYIEVPDSDSLALGTGDFSICAWVYTEKNVDDVLGDIASKYDPSRRKGFNLTLKSSSGGYQSSGDDRQVHFGIDNGRLSDWQDCGRPSRTSNYVSNSLTVYRGQLYAAIVDAKDEQDWCHVYRYEGGETWTDCGRVGDGKTTGVMSMIVHQGHLYAATTTYDWTRVFSGDYDACRVYRYEGGTRWTDCGQPGNSLRINCIASYQGKLYAGGDRGQPRPGETQWAGRPYHVYVYEGGTDWQVSGTFPAERPRNCYPHAMAVHDGKLYVGYPTVYAFDGTEWKYAGMPAGDTPKDLLPLLQVHCLEVYRGELHAGMWPEARAVAYQGGEAWEDRGRLGDGTEVNALVVYNGKLYGGAIPRAEVTRYDGGNSWTSLRRFYSPEGWTPAPPNAASPAQVNEWTRVTSLTVYQGRLFASIGSCTASVLDAPADVRGSVYSMEAGKCVSYDDNIGPGWKHIAAVRKNNQLAIHVNGRLVAESSTFRPDDYDLSNDAPLKIGFGEMDYFSGKIKEVRIYNRALDENEIAAAQSMNPPNHSKPLKAINVLLIGNSQCPTIVGNQLLETLAASDKDQRPIKVGGCIKGGASLRSHWEAGTGPTTARGMIAGGAWDYVVLQDIYNVEEPAFQPYARKFHALIQQTGSKTVLFGTASVLSDYPQGFERQHRLHLAMGKELGVPIVDASYAYIRYFGDKPATERMESLFAKDLRHPGLWGSYLYSCMIYSVLTERSPIGLAAPDAIPADVAKTLQETAWAQHQETMASLKK